MSVFLDDEPHDGDEPNEGFRIEQDISGHTLVDPPTFQHYVSPEFAYWAPYQVYGGQTLAVYPADKSYDPRTHPLHRHNHPPFCMGVPQPWNTNEFWTDGIRNKVWNTGGYEPRGVFIQPPQFGDSKKALDYKHQYDPTRFYETYMQGIQSFPHHPPRLPNTFIPYPVYSGMDVPGFLLPSKLYLDTIATSGLVTLSQNDKYLADMLPMLAFNHWCNPGMQKFMQMFYVFYWDAVCSQKTSVNIEIVFSYALLCMKGVAKRLWGSQFALQEITVDESSLNSKTIQAVAEIRNSAGSGGDMSFLNWLDTYLICATKHYHQSIAFEMAVRELPIHPNQMVSMHRQEMVMALELGFPFLDNRFVQV